MVNNDRLQQIISNVQLLNELANNMIDSDMYPVSFFSQAFDLLQKLQSDFHSLEADQVEMFAEQLKKHQALILSIHQQMRNYSMQTQKLISTPPDPSLAEILQNESLPQTTTVPKAEEPAQTDIPRTETPETKVEKTSKSSLFSRLGFSSSQKESEEQPIEPEKPMPVEIPVAAPLATEQAPPEAPIIRPEAPIIRPETPIIRPARPATPEAPEAPETPETPEIQQAKPTPPKIPVEKPVKPVPTETPEHVPTETQVVQPPTRQAPPEAPIARPTRPVPSTSQAIQQTQSAQQAAGNTSLDASPAKPLPPQTPREKLASTSATGIPSFLDPIGENAAEMRNVASRDSTLTEANQHPTIKDAIDKKKVADIRKAFSLNDRFLYRKELFGGSEEAMNKVVTILNNRQSLDESIQFLEQKLHWNLNDPIVKDFVKKLEMRFL